MDVSWYIPQSCNQETDNMPRHNSVDQLKKVLRSYQTSATFLYMVVKWQCMAKLGLMVLMDPWCYWKSTEGILGLYEETLNNIIKVND